jgi:SHS2 domain-containing protein
VVAVIISIDGRGTTVEEAFAQAADALTATVHAHIEAMDRTSISSSPSDLELRLVDWLDPFIFNMSVSGMLSAQYAVGSRGCMTPARLGMRLPSGGMGAVPGRRG